MNDFYHYMITLIAAMSQNRAIGRNGHLPWNLPEDMHRFRKLTTDNVVIMGRKTYQSIGRALPNRLNIVVSRAAPEQRLNDAGIHVTDSLQSAVTLARTMQPDSEIFIIGGAQIYQSALNERVADRLLLTVLHQTISDADTFFPDYEHVFPHTFSCEKWIGNDGRTLSFVDLRRFSIPSIPA